MSFFTIIGEKSCGLLNKMNLTDSKGDDFSCLVSLVS